MVAATQSEDLTGTLLTVDVSYTFMGVSIVWTHYTTQSFSTRQNFSPLSLKLRTNSVDVLVQT